MKRIYIANLNFSKIEEKNFIFQNDFNNMVDFFKQMSLDIWNSSNKENVFDIIPIINDGTQDYLNKIEENHNSNDILIVQNERNLRMRLADLDWRIALYHLMEKFKGSIWIANFDSRVPVQDPKHFMKNVSPILDHEYVENPSKEINILTSIDRPKWRKKYIEIDNLGKIVVSSGINAQYGLTNKNLLDKKLVVKKEYDIAYAGILLNSKYFDIGYADVKYDILDILKNKYHYNVKVEHYLNGPDEMNDFLNKAKFSLYFEENINPQPKLRYWEQGLSQSLQLHIPLNIYKNAIELAEDVHKQINHFSNYRIYKNELEKQHREILNYNYRLDRLNVALEMGLV